MVEQLAVVAIEDLCPIEDTGVLLVVGKPVKRIVFGLSCCSHSNCISYGMFVMTQWVIS